MNEDEVTETRAEANDIVDFSIVEDAIELVGVGFEVLGVAVIVIGFAWATLRLARGEYRRIHARPIHRYKLDIGLAIILGLELLVAADIISSIAVEPDFESLGVLAILVAIRTFLGWAVELDTQGRLPWQPEPDTPDTV